MLIFGFYFEFQILHGEVTCNTRFIEAIETTVDF